MFLNVTSDTSRPCCQSRGHMGSWCQGFRSEVRTTCSDSAGVGLCGSFPHCSCKYLPGFSEYTCHCFSTNCTQVKVRQCWTILHFQWSWVQLLPWSLVTLAWGGCWRRGQFGKVGWEEEKHESIPDSANETFVLQEVKGEREGKLSWNSGGSNSPAGC